MCENKNALIEAKNPAFMGKLYFFWLNDHEIQQYLLTFAVRKNRIKTRTLC